MTEPNAQNRGSPNGTVSSVPTSSIEPGISSDEAVIPVRHHGR